MRAHNVVVLVRPYSGTYIARAGRGKQSRQASSTNQPKYAALRAAAKWFAQFDGKNQEAEIQISELFTGGAKDHDAFNAYLPEEPKS